LSKLKASLRHDQCHRRNHAEALRLAARSTGISCSVEEITLISMTVPKPCGSAVGAQRCAHYLDARAS
jgi:hypothetical protein